MVGFLDFSILCISVHILHRLIRVQSHDAFCDTKVTYQNDYFESHLACGPVPDETDV